MKTSLQGSRSAMAPIPDADLPQLREVLAAISDCAITIYRCAIAINPRIVHRHTPYILRITIRPTDRVVIRYAEDGKYLIEVPRGVQYYDDVNHLLRHIRAEVRSALEVI